MNVSEPSAVQSSLRGLCPRCGAVTLFDGIATFAPKCRACGLDYSSFNVGDGPAAFLTLLVGGLITGLAIAFELMVTPPFWLHILLWVPLTAAAVIFALRYAKAGLLVLEYKNRAREGRITLDEGD
ncbi:MAG: DUF983 domain-containing protein [Allosphingosinicella sp.]|uniref:DUF983 domain-containing protein n=1 Tax=Allosphingosinicella sp. TaxID=2823234 RepID=UPI0039287A6D